MFRLIVFFMCGVAVGGRRHDFKDEFEDTYIGDGAAALGSDSGSMTVKFSAGAERLAGMDRQRYVRSSENQAKSRNIYENQCKSTSTPRHASAQTSTPRRATP